jgi:hypothetical protein
MNSQITAPNKRTYMTFPMKADIIPKKGTGHAIKRKINLITQFTAKPLTALCKRS